MKIVICLSLLLVFGTPSSSFALDALKSSDLTVLCESETSSERIACQAYLQGFIDGALGTDPSVANNVVKESSTLDSITERAIRTRVQSRLRTYGPSFYAGFCLPPSLQVSELQETLLIDVQARAEEDLARERLLHILQRDFPCTVKPQDK